MKKLIFLLMIAFISMHFSLRKQNAKTFTAILFCIRKEFRWKKIWRERVIAKTFSMPLDSNSEYKYELACGAISQFLFINNDVEKGFEKLFLKYDSLEYDTKKSFLEALYAVSPKKYFINVQQILMKENDPKLFSMCAVYLYRADTSAENYNSIKIKMVENFPGYDSLIILNELQNYLSYHSSLINKKTPDIVQLFSYQKNSNQKIIYSFQRWNRDYAGLAVVQNADGSFVKDAKGRLLIFEQLARSGSDLPYFITNGSTPQGIYSIQGTNVAHNNFIGPTPNIQLIMPFENTWKKYFHADADSIFDSLNLYKKLLPPSWKNYEPMMEAWNAGKTGRTEIIAHGTALDPEYFKDKSFYPLTPTLGCLCAKELWNPTSGRLLVSEQFNLVSAFQSTTGNKGYLFVINIDDQQKAVSRIEVENFVKKFESRK